MMSSVGAPIAWLPWFMRVTSFPGVSRLMAALPATERSVRMTFRQIGHGPSLEAGRITREDIETYLALLRYTDTMRNELAMGRAFVSPIHGLNRVLLPESMLAGIRTPTHFVWGENDPFGGTDTARHLVQPMPNASLEVIPGAGHAPWLDDLDRCVSATSAFLGVTRLAAAPPPQRGATRPGLP